MNRANLRNYLVVFLKGALLCAAILSVFMLLVSLTAPETANRFGFGPRLLADDLSGQAASLLTTLRIKPALDIPLLLGSYGLVCVVLWLHQGLVRYWQNRSHFE